MTCWADYLKAIEIEIKAGKSTEHTHRPALKTLVESSGSGVLATNEPRRVACGAPDYTITRSQTPLGYIAKGEVL